MFTLYTGLECYSPVYLGHMDLLVASDRIIRMFRPDDTVRRELDRYADIYKCDGLLAFPGLIDQHLHIIGGGGEEGPSGRIPEISIDEIVNAGVTTVAGLLGADIIAKGITNLLMKADSLEMQGITAYIYTGGYTLPTVTITGSIIKDIAVIGKIIGTKVAISDHRSSVPTLHELLRLASETHLGGLLGRKAGVVHIHVGDGKSGLDPVKELLSSCDLPCSMFVPTHLNRSRKLFNQAVEYCKRGGNIDLTAGESVGISVPDAMKELLDAGVSPSGITVSSDANGSVPGGSAGKISSLLEDIKKCILDKKIVPSSAFAAVTSNTAKLLKLYPRKGTLSEGSDADILITDKELNIRKLVCKGSLLVDIA